MVHGDDRHLGLLIRARWTIMAACAPSNAPLEQQDLAAALLGRGPEHGHPRRRRPPWPGPCRPRRPWPRSRCARRRGRRPAGRRTRRTRPRAAAPTRPGRERRRRSPALDLEPGPSSGSHSQAQACSSSELGVGVDAVAERHQLVPGLGDPLPAASLASATSASPVLDQVSIPSSTRSRPKVNSSSGSSSSSNAGRDHRVQGREQPFGSRPRQFLPRLGAPSSPGGAATCHLRDVDVGSRCLVPGPRR